MESGTELTLPDEAGRISLRHAVYVCLVGSTLCALFGFLAGRAARPELREYLVPVGIEVEAQVIGRDGKPAKGMRVVPINKLVSEKDARLWAKAVAEEQAKATR